MTGASTGGTTSDSVTTSSTSDASDCREDPGDIPGGFVDYAYAFQDPAMRAALIRQNGGGSRYEFGLIVLPQD